MLSESAYKALVMTTARPRIRTQVLLMLCIRVWVRSLTQSQTFEVACTVPKVLFGAMLAAAAAALSDGPTGTANPRGKHV